MNTTHLIACARADSPLGPILLAATGQGLAGFWFEGQAHHPGTLAVPEVPDHPHIAQALRELKEYWAGRRNGFDVPLDPRGTPFQRDVWQALRRIPAGGTVSYAALANGIGRPAAVRAVGAAVGRNPISVIVPCHRVIGSSGHLTGYAGGLPRKTALLRLERALPMLKEAA